MRAAALVLGWIVVSVFLASAARAQPQRVIACTTGCGYPAMLDLSTTQTVQGFQQETACQRIDAGPYPIGSMANVTFTAGQTIVFRPGFSVAYGGAFQAVINPSLAPPP